MINDSPKLCECGCGRPAPIATRTRPDRGQVKGQPVKFIMGHAIRNHFAPPEERLWAQVDTSGGPDACHPWTGNKNRKGYGHLMVGQHVVAAHRFAYELHYGPIPDGMLVCHNCPGGDNPACCNWRHLFVGTILDNNRDRANKGRYASGEQHVNAKITANEVREIRERWARGGIISEDLGRDYGISSSNVLMIVNRHAWQHVE